MNGTDTALLAFGRAVATADDASALEQLATRPELAHARMEAGATRAAPTDAYLPEIVHHVYAGQCALHLAAAAHRPVVVEALLALGADVDAADRRGAQPLHCAAMSRPGEPRWDPSGQAETIGRLLAAGVDPRACDKVGAMPLHRAVRTRGASAVEALLAGGADPSAPNGHGSTPLDLARAATGRGGSGTPAAKEQQALIVAMLKRAAPAPT